jgi:hypothetical protein
MCPRDFCFCTLITAGAPSIQQQQLKMLHNKSTVTAAVERALPTLLLSAAAAAFGATSITQRGVSDGTVTAGAVRSSSFDHTTANTGVNGSSSSSSTGNCGYGGRWVSQNARARSESWPEQRVQVCSTA